MYFECSGGTESCPLVFVTEVGVGVGVGFGRLDVREVLVELYEVVDEGVNGLKVVVLVEVDAGLALELVVEVEDDVDLGVGLGVGEGVDFDEQRGVLRLSKKHTELGGQQKLTPLHGRYPGVLHGYHLT